LDNLLVIRGLLLDFYGTVVEDDDATMMAIATEVAAGASAVVAPGEVMAAWAGEYAAIAEGTPFRSLRASAVLSLGIVMTRYDCPGDPAVLGAPQFDRAGFLPLRPGTRAFLDAVALPICVVSDADAAGLFATIAHHGLVFDAVVCSEEVGAYKPAAAMFERGLAALGLAAHEVLHVGDSVRSDVLGAHAAGIRAAWINRRGRPAAEGGPAAYVLNDRSDLLAVV
jgi:2-haloacid dehalogenase/putative hydrolase of the HAD superfamily